MVPNREQSVLLVDSGSGREWRSNGLNPKLRTRLPTRQTAGTTIGTIRQHSAGSLGSYGQSHLRVQRQQQTLGLLHLSDGNRRHPLSVWWAPRMTIPYPAEPDRKETAHVYLANYTARVQRHDDQRVRFRLCGIRQRRRPHQYQRRQPQGPWLPSAESLRFVTPRRPDSRTPRRMEIRPDRNQGHSISTAASMARTASARPPRPQPSAIPSRRSSALTRIKAGFYWDTQENLQASGTTSTAYYDFETWGAPSTYNQTLDR